LPLRESDALQGCRDRKRPRCAAQTRERSGRCSFLPGSRFFNWLQLVAEDNTPDAYAQATLWRMDTVSPRPPVPLYSTTTSDQPGVQIAVNDTLYDTLDEEQYVYWIEVRLVRTTPDASVIVYSTGLKDVF